jgi:hypothetical protein
VVVRLVVAGVFLGVVGVLLVGTGLLVGLPVVPLLGGAAAQE